MSGKPSGLGKNDSAELAEIKNIIKNMKPPKEDQAVVQVLPKINKLIEDQKFDDAIEAILEYANAGNQQNQTPTFISKLRMVLRGQDETVRINAMETISQRINTLKDLKILAITEAMLYYCQTLAAKKMDLEVVTELVIRVFTESTERFTSSTNPSEKTQMQGYINSCVKIMGSILDIVEQAGPDSYPKIRQLITSRDGQTLVKRLPVRETIIVDF